MEESGSVRQPEWLRLDTAANVYPPSRGRNWSFQFRVAATLNGEIDPEALNRAAIRTVNRYPAYNVRIKSGIFWHYLKRNPLPPPVIEDGCCPCEPLRPEENNGFAFRIRYFRSRIAVEFFHALTDGSGAVSFLKTLIAEYLALKYGVLVPRGGDLLDCGKEPDFPEFEDSFKRYSGNITVSRRERSAFHIKGRPEPDGFINLTGGVIPAGELLSRAKDRGVTVTQYLAGVLLLALADIQKSSQGFREKRKPLKVSIPINLRGFFPSVTTRNFSSYVNIGIDPRYGDFTLDEAISAVHYQMGAEVTPKKLRAKFTTNVRNETNLFVRFVPLFIKSPFLKAAYRLAGDSKNSATISNMGKVVLPDEMEPFVNRLELIMGPPSVNPVGCAVISYGDTLYFNITRTIVEPKLEKAFFTRLVKLGIPVKIESNRRYPGI